MCINSQQEKQIIFLIIFIRPSRDGLYYVIGYGGRACGRLGGCPHRFPHSNFSSVYRIFTKLGHMIPLWKGKNPIYFGVIRSKVKVTITINRISDGHILWCTHLLFYFGSLPIVCFVINNFTGMR